MSDLLERLYAAEAVGDLDLHFARLMMRLAGTDDPELALGAALASHATSEGNVCVDLASVAGKPLPREGTPVGKAPDLGRFEAALRRTSIVAGDEEARSGDRSPLVLDGAHRLFLYRYWHYQEELARNLLARANAPLRGDGLTVWERDRLDLLFPPDPERAGEIDWQRLAAAIALLRPLCVVSGGPGTGKTTTVTKILVLLIESALREAPDRQPRIALAAPTGKAAARMVDAIRQARDRLELDDAVAAAIPDEASTLQRLLGYRRGSVSFRHDRDNPLPVDVLVVDEASMVDLANMAKLVRALPDGARLILLGDRDQLASVEAGAVLGDICARPSGFTSGLSSRLGDLADGVPEAPSDTAAIGDSIVLLRHSYRFGETSGIGAAARAVNAGDAGGALEVLRDEQIEDAGFGDVATLAGSLAERVDRGFGAYLDSTDPREAFERFESFRILCARRTGSHGSETLNARIETMLADRRIVDRREAFYRGRPVLITENDYGLRLFNGDVGIVLPDEESGGALRVCFLGSDGEVRKIAPARLPSHETAFAMTVHKSQGSEFDEVLLVIPDEPSPVLTRELVYTGLTRARSRIEVLASEAAFRGAVETSIERSSGLRDALWGAGVTASGSSHEEASEAEEVAPSPVAAAPTASTEAPESESSSTAGEDRGKAVRRRGSRKDNDDPQQLRLF